MKEVAHIQGCSQCAPVIAALRAENARLRAENAELKQRLARVEERLGLNSTNSHKPPSSDPPSVQRANKPGSGRRRGGQPGHPGKTRKMAPVERVDEFVEVLPQRCARCQAPLEGQDPHPQRHQFVELPPIRAKLTEVRLHQLRCGRCGHRNRAELPAGVPRGSFGPRLQGLVALLSGAYRLSKRPIQQLLGDLFDVPLGLGSVPALEKRVSQALGGAVEEAREFVRQSTTAAGVHIDETGWRQENRRAWLWTAVREKVGVFVIRFSRGSKVARELLGEEVEGVAHSDRWSAYNWIPDTARQLCWAHLLRDFKKIAQRSGESGFLAGLVLELMGQVLHQWKRVRDGPLERGVLEILSEAWFEPQMRRFLEEGSQSEDGDLAGLCRWLLAHEPALWRFVHRPGVEPTNNKAERALRHAVIWRRQSHGTQSRSGSEFVERMLTVVTSLRLQGRNVLEYLNQAVHAALMGLAPPSLLPQTHSTTHSSQCLSIA